MLLFRQGFFSFGVASRLLNPSFKTGVPLLVSYYSYTNRLWPTQWTSSWRGIQRSRNGSTITLTQRKETTGTMESLLVHDSFSCGICTHLWLKSTAVFFVAMTNTLRSIVLSIFTLINSAYVCAAFDVFSFCKQLERGFRAGVQASHGAWISSICRPSARVPKATFLRTSLNGCAKMPF